MLVSLWLGMVLRAGAGSGGPQRMSAGQGQGREETGGRNNV